MSSNLVFIYIYTCLFPLLTALILFFILIFLGKIIFSIPLQLIRTPNGYLRYLGKDYWFCYRRALQPRSSWIATKFLALKFLCCTCDKFTFLFFDINPDCPENGYKEDDRHVFRMYLLFLIKIVFVFVYRGDVVFFLPGLLI